MESTLNGRFTLRNDSTDCSAVTIFPLIHSSSHRMVYLSDKNYLKSRITGILDWRLDTHSSVMMWLDHTRCDRLPQWSVPTGVALCACVFWLIRCTYIPSSRKNVRLWRVGACLGHVTCYRTMDSNHRIVAGGLRHERGSLSLGPLGLGLPTLLPCILCSPTHVGCYLIYRAFSHQLATISLNVASMLALYNPCNPL